MSIQFNDTTNYRGLVQLYEREIGANLGDVANDTTRLKEFTADANQALDDFIAIAIQSSGTWQFDDSNHTDYPEIRTNLVSGQRDYAFVTDGSGNLILDIYRVFVDDGSGTFSEIRPVDKQSQSDTTGFYDGKDGSGVPIKYDKTANAIFLDPVPNYNATNGLKVYINREGFYFTTADTTKKPGVPGLYHAYFYLKPAYEYARRNRLANFVEIQNDVLRMEEKIAEAFALRSKDEVRRLSITKHSNK